MMNCLYLIRGAAGNTLSQPQFTNSSIWMFDNEYRPSLSEDLLKLNQLLTTINNINNNINNHINSISNDNGSGSSDNNNNNSNIELSNNNNENKEKSEDSNVNNINNNNNNTHSNNSTSTTATTTENIQDQLFIKEFLEDFTTRVLWFTYRQGFPFIDKTLFDNDCGWGCMLRSGQMLLSNVLLHNTLGNDWKRSSSLTHPLVYNNIISMFLDKPSAPFSIHNIAMEGQTLGKNIGEWFAPSIISQTIKTLVSRNYGQCKISVFISEDGSLYIDQLLNISLKNKKKISSTEEEEEEEKEKEEEQPEAATEESVARKKLQQENKINNTTNKNDNNNTKTEQQQEEEDDDENETWEPLLILIPMRLGLDGLNSIYHSSLLEIFKFPQNLGVVGGKPRASLYFIAAQDDNLFYLDPHTVQNHIEVESGSSFPLNTFFCSTTKRTHVSEVDPSLVVAFFCKTRSDFTDFVERSKKMTSQMENPIFSIFDNEPDYDSSRDYEYEEIDETGGETSDDIDIENDYHMM